MVTDFRKVWDLIVDRCTSFYTSHPNGTRGVGTTTAAESLYYHIGRISSGPAPFIIDVTLFFFSLSLLAFDHPILAVQPDETECLIFSLFYAV